MEILFIIIFFMQAATIALVYLLKNQLKEIFEQNGLTKRCLDAYIALNAAENAELKKQIDRSFADLREKLEQLKVRIEESNKKPQAEKWTSLREAFKSPVMSVEINERS